MYWAANAGAGDTVVVQRPYYYVLDRMYNVFGLVDRAGAFVERYGYNGYGRPLIRESCGRGDFDQDTMLTSIDSDRMDEVYAATKWDPRADIDDDGDVDEVDYEMYTSDKYPLWSDDMSGPTVSSAFSDFGNWYMFQGVPHLALDTAAGATAGKLPLNHHRARYADPVTGRWLSRDPLDYHTQLLMTHEPDSLSAPHDSMLSAIHYYLFDASSPTNRLDSAGLFADPTDPNLGSSHPFGPNSKPGIHFTIPPSVGPPSPVPSAPPCFTNDFQLLPPTAIYQISLNCPFSRRVFLQKVIRHKLFCHCEKPAAGDECVGEITCHWEAKAQDPGGPGEDTFGFKAPPSGRGGIVFSSEMYCVSHADKRLLFGNTIGVGNCVPQGVASGNFETACCNANFPGGDPSVRLGPAVATKTLSAVFDNCCGASFFDAQIRSSGASQSCP